MATENIVESFEDFDYRPPISVDLSIQGLEFPIIIFNEDIVTQPSKSCLILTGRVYATKALDGGAREHFEPITPEDLYTVNNAFLHLFDRIDYYIGDTKIDSVRNPGITSTMKGLVSFENDLNLNEACWKIKNKGSEIMNSRGYFSVCIPLSIVLGFFEDFKQFLYKIPQKLVFTKSSAPGQTNKLFFTPGNNPRDVQIQFDLRELVWRMPQVKFSIEYETKIREDILNGMDYVLQFRSWMYQSISGIRGQEYCWDIPTSYSRVKYVLLAFQKHQGNTMTTDASIFDLCNLENCQVLMNNNTYYPRQRLNLNYSENKCVTLYKMYKNFKASYYNEPDEAKLEPLVDCGTFLNEYPIIAIDCSYVPNVLKESLINIRINFNWRSNFDITSTIHCVMIMDNKAVYNPLHNRVITT